MAARSNDADFILEQANLLYANEHQHGIGIDGWTEKDNLPGPSSRQVGKDVRALWFG